MRVSMVEIQKRCMKHQKNETEAKRQLIVYQNMIVSLCYTYKSVVIHLGTYL